MPSVLNKPLHPNSTYRCYLDLSQKGGLGLLILPSPVKSGFWSFDRLDAQGPARLRSIERSTQSILGRTPLELDLRDHLAHLLLYSSLPLQPPGCSFHLPHDTPLNLNNFFLTSFLSYFSLYRVGFIPLRYPQICFKRGKLG